SPAATASTIPFHTMPADAGTLPHSPLRPFRSFPFAAKSGSGSDVGSPSAADPPPDPSGERASARAGTTRESGSGAGSSDSPPRKAAAPATAPEETRRASAAEAPRAQPAPIAASNAAFNSAALP